MARGRKPATSGEVQPSTTYGFYRCLREKTSARISLNIFEGRALSQCNHHKASRSSSDNPKYNLKYTSLFFTSVFGGVLEVFGGVFGGCLGVFRKDFCGVPQGCMG